MLRQTTMVIDPALASKMEEFLHVAPLDCGRDEVLFDHEVLFEDGTRGVVQVIAPNSPEDGDTAWSQCVLFDTDGHEMSVSVPCDSLLGAFHMDYFDDTYVVNVTAG
jgi:hypothetical protein